MKGSSPDQAECCAARPTAAALLPLGGGSTHLHNHHHDDPSRRPSVALKSQKDWWKSAIVKRTLEYIERDLAAVTEASPFLQDTPMQPHALLHRSEIITGRRLGKGGFSYVYEIVAIELNEEISQYLSPRERQARRHLAASCLDDRQRPRYALKHLQDQLLESRKGPQEFRFAATDLAVEAAFLSRLCHDNIVACRGLPLGGLKAFAEAGQHDAFFIVMDLAHDTLDHRIHTWEQQKRQQQQTVPFPSNTTSPSSSFHHLHPDRMQLALQIAQGLEYLHFHRIVFRDLKPSNIGLIIDPKDGTERALLMDFGLCRELPRSYGSLAETSTMNETFEMSGVGTRRYMAVEIVNSSRYNCKADVYSWAMLVWEMLSHTKPFASYSMEDHRQYVCQRGVRPRLNWTEWSESICHLLQATWDQDVSSRLSMEEVVTLLRSLLKSDEQLSSLQDYTAHADNSHSEEQERDDSIGAVASSTQPNASLKQVGAGSNSADAVAVAANKNNQIKAAKSKMHYTFADVAAIVKKSNKKIPFDLLPTQSFSFDCASTFVGSTAADSESQTFMTVSVSSMSVSAD